MTLTFEPQLPPILWITLAVLSVGMWVWYVSRRPQACSRSLWGLVSTLSALAVISVLTVLLNPIWMEPLPPPAGKPLLTILVDESASMQTIDDGGKQTRFQLAAESVSDLIADVQSTFEVRVRTFGETTRATTAEELGNIVPASNVTNVSAPLIDALGSDQPQGQAVLLVGDGIHNATSDTRAALEAAEVARSRDAPVYTTTIGSKKNVDDIEIRVPRSQELAFAGQSIPVLAEIEQHGQVGDRVTVELTDPDGNTQTQEVRLTANATASATFLVTPPETGLFQYRIKSAALPGEATPNNNATSFQVRVVDKPVKALVLEGKPYWDGKFLLRTLTDDPSLEVDSIVRLSDERFLHRKLKLVDAEQNEDKPAGDSVGLKASGGSSTHQLTNMVIPQDEKSNAPSPPAQRFRREEETRFVNDLSELLGDPKALGEYQILLLGREAEFYLDANAVENIRRWMAERGGALVCYRGAPVAEPTRRLSRLLPVKWAAGKSVASNDERFRIQVTERGDDLSWLQIGGRDGLAKLPSLARSGATDAIKPLAVVLGRGDNAATPVFTFQPYGMGKAVVVEGSGMWRWAFLPPEHREMDAAYGTLWQSLLRWLISGGGLLPDEDVALQMDRVQFTEGESVSAVVLRRPELISGDVPDIKLLKDGEAIQSIQPIPVGEELGVYQVFAGKLPTGRYQLELGETKERIGTRSIHFDVQPDMRERLEVSARSDLMSRIAEISGGEVLATSEMATLAKKYTQHVQKTRPVQYRRRPAWDRWWVLIGVFALWTTSWTLRRRTGLI